MHIKTVTIENYKSFLERQTISLANGFNLLVGTNNAGKSSVLDVIDLDPNLGDPHRSSRNIPEYGGQPNTQSQFEVTIATRYSELRHLVGTNQVQLPLVSSNAHLNGIDVKQSIRAFIDSDGPMTVTSIFGSGTSSARILASEPIQGLALTQNGNFAPSCQITYVSNAGSPDIQVGNFDLSRTAAIYGQSFKPRVYRFSATRRPGFQCAAMSNSTLDREAAALPYCINHLQTNDAHGHNILCGWVNRVFPSVRWVQATPINGNFELRCLSQMPEARRDDLAIPIARMGTGIGNVIAMFYVLLTARAPQVIAIDEPNAFLHPRALRELLCILEAEGKQHQFILTAHSADVLTAVNAKSISFLDFDGEVTTVKHVGANEFHLLRGGLAELGIRITDLHAKDRVMWVEGQTEEMVMPELLRWACPEIAAGTSILRVERTGTFDKKSVEPEEVARIYERLSSSSALVPPMVGILLDRESRTPEKRLQIEAASQGKLRFLDRRMLENYLLHPLALTAAMSALGLTTDQESVTALLSRQTTTRDVAELDGAAVLKTVFSELSGASLEFRKTRDVPILVTWILENDPEYLNPLGECLKKSFGF